MSFIDFWTNNNNPKLENYLYGPRHIIVLCITVALLLALIFIFRKKSEKAQNVVFNTIAGILLFFEISTRIVNLIIAESYSVESVLKILLPMHICSVMVWVFIIAIFTKNKTLINFSAIGGLLATLAFLLYPATGLNRVYMSFTCIYSTVSHMLGFICAILLIVFGRAKFEFKDLWKMLLCFAIMFAWGVLLDFVIFPGSDYMYLVNDPLELNLPIPYQIVYGFVLLLYILSFYFITWLHRKIKKRKTLNEKNN